MPKNTVQIEKNRQAKVMRQKARAKARKQPTTAPFADVLQGLEPDRAHAVLQEARRVHRGMRVGE
jgi:hypothetical protein